MLLNYALLARQLAASLRPARHPTLRLGSRRIRFLVVFCLAFPLLWLTGVLTLALDNVFYPRYRRGPRRAPVFIVGNFRTGSSFLFRLLAHDRSSFTCMRTWELYFAPSILLRRLWTGIFAVDRLLGSPMRRLLRDRQETFFRDVQLHRIRLEEPEEDEALFCLTWHTLFTCFFFPLDIPGFPYPRFDEALPASTRRRVLDFYDGCIRRHQFAHRSSAHYLSKNPSATARMGSLARRYPDARFICLYRDPLEAVPSTMRWFSFAWHYFSSAPDRYPLREFVLSLIDRLYGYPLRMREGPAAGRIHFVSYEELVSDPRSVVLEIYRYLGLRASPRFLAHVDLEAWEARTHRPDGTGDLTGTGLTEEDIEKRYRSVARVYERLLSRSSEPDGPGKLQPEEEGQPREAPQTH